MLIVSNGSSLYKVIIHVWSLEIVSKFVVISGNRVFIWYMYCRMSDLDWL